MQLYIRFFIVKLFLFLTLNCQGQAPGYLGKRFFVEGHLGPHANLKLQSGEGGIVTLKPAAKISLNWVRNRYRYIAVEADYQLYNVTQSPLLNFPDQPALKYRISTQTIGLGFYRTARRSKRTLAPIGFYYGYKFYYGSALASPTKYADSNEKFEGVERAAFNLLYKKTHLNLFGVAFSSGLRKIIKDKFTISYALEYGYKFTIENPLLNDGRSYAFSPNELKKSNSLYMNFTLGAGILLF